MTPTDAFTDAATAAYEDYVRTPKMNVGTFRDRIAEAYMDAAMWARDHLARQEVTDAEVEAATLGELAYLQGYDLANEEDRTEVLAWWNRMGEEARNSRLATARAALAAAKEARHG